MNFLIILEVNKTATENLLFSLYIITWFKRWKRYISRKYYLHVWHIRM